MFKDRFVKEISKNQQKLMTGLSLFVICFCTAEISYAENSDSAGQFYENALIKQHNGNNKAAILELKNAIQQNPAYIAAHILLAKAYLKEKDLIATEVALSQADKLAADPELLVLTRAQLYLYQLKYSQLLKEIIPSQFSRSLQPDLHLYRGHAYLELNQLAYAQNEYQEAARLQPNRIEPVIGLANVLLRLNNIKGATEAAEKAAAMQPDSADSWYIKGAINHAQGYLKPALADYQQAIKNNPEHQASRISHAGILMDLGRDKEAEADLAYLRDSYPFDAKAAYLYAVVLSRNNREKEAREALLSAAESLDSIEPKFLSKHSQTLMLTALVNYSLKKFDLASHFLDVYVKKHPDQTGAYKLLASIFLDKGENEKVIKLLQPLKSKASNDNRLLFILGTAYMQNGQHDQANSLFEKISTQGFKEGGIQTEIGLNHLAMGQNDLAIKDLKAVINNNPGDIKAGIPLALTYISQGKMEQALDIASKMHKQAPDNLTVINLRGTAQAAAGKYQQARKSFEKVIAKDAKFLTAHINLSKLDIAVKNNDKAKQRLNDLIKQYPENIALLIEMANIFQIEGNNEVASDWIKKALKVDAKSIVAKIALIELKLKMKRPEEALVLALEAQKQDRDNMQVLETLARSFMANNNKRKAMGVLQNMSENAGFNAKQLFEIAQRQYEISDYQAAIKSLKKAILGSQNYIPARVALADIELQQGELIFAKNQAVFLTKNFPERPFGYRILGDIAVKEKKLLQAVKDYQTAFSKSPQSYLLMKLYVALKQTGENTKAFQLVEQWVKAHPQDIIPTKALAEEHLHAGNLETAQKLYQQLVKQTGNQADLLNNLANIYFAMDDKRALEYAQQAQKLAQDSSITNDTLGWILVNQGQVEQGLHYLRTAYARSSQDPEIQYHIAQALFLLKRFDEAKRELKAALTNKPEVNVRKKVEALLQKLSN